MEGQTEERKIEKKSELPRAKIPSKQINKRETVLAALLENFNVIVTCLQIKFK